MTPRLFVLFLPPALALACGSDRGTSPGLPGGPGVAAPVLVADAGPVLGDAYGGQYPPDIRVAAEPGGTVLALWTEAPRPARVRAARFDPVQGWQSPATLGTASSVGPGGVSLDASGRGVAVWTQCCPWLTWAARYDRTAGWSAPERAQTDPTGVGGTQGRSVPRLFTTLVARATTGEAFALWSHRDVAYSGCFPNCPPYALAAARFTPEGGWQAPEIVLSDQVYDRTYDATFDDEGRIAVAAAGRGSSGIVVVRYDGSRGWSRAATLAEYPANAPRIAAGLDGRLALLWRNAFPHYVGSLFDPGAGWSDPAGVVDADVVTGLAFDAAGAGTLLWIEGGALRSRVLSPAAIWGQVEAVTDVQADSAALLVEPDGDASVVFWSGSELRLVRRTKNGSWSVARLLAISSAPVHTTPSLIADSHGSAFAVWADVQNRNVSIWTVGFQTPGP